VIDAFDAHPGVGALKLDGKMIDRPHLLQAQRILAQVA
jgi:citrate lyase subunit beta/citryl-CoA lyase